MGAETGVLVSWDGEDTRLWARCDRAGAERAVRELAALYPGAFARPGVKAEFGADRREGFEPQSEIDLKALGLAG